MIEETLESIFHNRIPKIWKDYEPRESQFQMSTIIMESIHKESHIILEAGTGVGKSLAYLIPSAIYSINSGKTVVISTETKALQDQLLEKDIPLLQQILDIKIEAKLAMGAGNYLCKRKLQQIDESGNIPIDLLHQWDEFTDWSNQTTIGIKSDYKGILTSDIWSKLGREVDNCLGKACPNYSTSFYFKARDSWRTANILIANHSLLSFHLIGGYNLLPDFDVLVIDEAHNFPDIMSKSMRLSLNYDQTNRLFNMIHTKDNKTTLLQRLQYPDNLVQLTEESREQIIHVFGKISEEILNMYGKERILKPLYLDGGKLESHLNSLVEGFIQKSEKYSKDSDNPEEKEISISLEMAIGRLSGIANFIHELRTRQDENLVFWTEPPDLRKNERFITIYSEPMNVNEIISDRIGSTIKSVIYTSATLSSNKKNFQYFRSQLGYEPSQENWYPSPFDYSKNSLLYVPLGIPDPNNYNDLYHDSILNHIQNLIHLTKGNCFVLFTSMKSLNLIKKKLDVSIPYPILSQNDLGAYGAKESFLKTPNSVLLGVNSFWQGVDVKGEKLQNVIITKLPFQVPTEPVLLTRTEMMKKNNKDPFKEFQLPRACILLKQGFGRLIRSSKDIGIVSVLDPRILTKNYGKDFLKVFPEGIKIINNFEDLVSSYDRLPKI